jgi:hypothetical protein
MYQAATAQDANRQDRILKSRAKPTTCPWCGSHRIAIILDGMPVYIPEFENELAEGQKHMNPNDSPRHRSQPSWQCTECGAHFYRDLPRHADRC